jgi:hypothetical protein
MDGSRSGLAPDIRTAIEAAGDRLAPSHAAALRLAADGASDGEIARSLEIPAEAVAPLLEVARAKLARLALVVVLMVLTASHPATSRLTVMQTVTPPPGPCVFASRVEVAVRIHDSTGALAAERAQIIT